MNGKAPETLGDFMAEYEAELIAAANTPEALAKEALEADRRKARLAEEHAKGVRLGWWNEDGNPLNVEDEDDEDDEEETEGKL